jgi:hypothetical protein
MKRIILLEFKRTSDTSETYYKDMKKISDTQHTPILTGLNARVKKGPSRATHGERPRMVQMEVEVLSLVAGQRSVNERERLESLKVFGIRAEGGKQMLNQLGRTLLFEHEKLFGS